MRPVKEWIGSSPTAKIPDRVKRRIWLRENGKCYLTGRKINVGDKHQFEHEIALVNGGEHSESNIRLALDAPHKLKTKSDLAEKAKVARLFNAHHGIKKPKSNLSNSPYKRKIGGQVVWKDTGEPV